MSATYDPMLKRARRRLTCERVLRHEDADDHDVRRARALAPAHAVDARVIYEGLEDKLGGLVLGRRGEDGYDDSSRPDGVPPDRYVVNVLQKVHAECVDESLTDEHPGVYPNGGARLGNEGGVEGCKGRDEVCCCITVSNGE